MIITVIFILLPYWWYYSSRIYRKLSLKACSVQAIAYFRIWLKPWRKKLLSNILFNLLLIKDNSGFYENNILCIISYIILGKFSCTFLTSLLRLHCLFCSGILFVIIGLLLKFQSVLQFKSQVHINVIPGHLFWLK